MAETKIPEYLGTGRRKTAIARVRLASGTGKITVNGRQFEKLFPAGNAALNRGATTDRYRFDGEIQCAHQRHRRRANGPGRRVRQWHCPRVAAITRPWRGALKAEGLLTRDSRMKSARNTASRARANVSNIRNVNRTGKFPGPAGSIRRGFFAWVAECFEKWSVANSIAPLLHYSNN